MSKGVVAAIRGENSFLFKATVASRSDYSILEIFGYHITLYVIQK